MLLLVNEGVCGASFAGDRAIRGQMPAWVMAGQTTTVCLYGEDLKPTTLQFDEPGFLAKLVQVSRFSGKTDLDKRWGNTEIQAEITVPAASRPGLHGFHLTGSAGPAGEGQLLTDVAAPEIQEKEPNDSLRAPQILPAGPVTVVGKLERQGADVFQFQAQKGEIWRLEIFARRLNPPSKLEACLRLRDPRHAPVRAAVDDGDDCALEYQAPVTGPYLIELFDGDNRTGGDFTYRLAVRRVAVSTSAH